MHRLDKRYRDTIDFKNFALSENRQRIALIIWFYAVMNFIMTEEAA
jgi:hypothetical protein